MKEDDLVSRIIEYHDNLEEYSYEHFPEQHYNHYGSRGVVDLHEVCLLTTNRTGISHVRDEHVFEIKGAAAIKESTGANEIVRQYNKMCSYFYMDESNHRPEPLHSVRFELAFLPEREAIRHVWENRSIYSQLKNSEVNGVGSAVDVHNLVTFRSPFSDDIFPVHVDTRHAANLESWMNHARVMNQDIAKAIEETFL